MRTRYTYRDGVLLAEMIERETAEETTQFVDGVVAALREHRANRVLISVISSRPLFKVEEWKLSTAIEAIKQIEGFRVAFVADAKEVKMSQEYICMLLTQRGIQCRVCADTTEALAWLTP